MRTRPTLFRLSAALAIAGTSAAALLPASAMAQTAPGQTAPGQTAPGPAPAAGDPPSRVGRLARLSGTVSFHTADQTQWGPASLNYPVTSGNAFWTEPTAAAQIEVGATHLAMDQQTEFDVDTLDATQLASTAPQGALYVRIDAVNPGETTTVRTPRGTVSIGGVGRYEIAAGDTERPTTVTVIDGSAQVTADPNLSLSVGPHQTATITGSDQFQGSVGPETDDPFLTAQLAAEQAPAPAAPPLATPAPTANATANANVTVYQPPPVVQQMTGASDLQSSGSWAEAPQYGHVWYPPVERDWVPYRHGHWAYVAPWGWTWVDDAAWGFAPYHYGRWVDVDDRWGWVPVAPEAPVDVEPVYSPALVDFVGIAAGVAVGAAIGVGLGLAFGGGGGGGGNIGWVPLGFNEPYIPPYGGSAGYVNRINSPNFNRTQNVGTLIDQRRNFINNGTINRSNTTINNYYGNAAGATVAPASVLQTSAPVAAVGHTVTAQQFAQIAQPKATIPAPTAQTAGLTPRAAQKFNIPAAQLAQKTAAPGPARFAAANGRVPLPTAAATAGGKPVAEPNGAPGARLPGAAEPAAKGGLSGGLPAAAAVGAAGLGAAGLAAAATAHPGLPTLTPHGAAAPVRAAGAASPGPAIARPTTPQPARAGVAPNAAPGPAITSPARPGTPGLATPGLATPGLATGAAAAHPVTPGPALRPATPGATSPRPVAPAASGAPAAPKAPTVPHAAPPAAVSRPAAPRPATAPYHPPAAVARPAAPVYHPPAPAAVARPAAPVYHPPAPAVVARPAAPVYHPPAPVYHPQPAAARPAPPAPRPAPPPPPARKACPPGHATC